MIRTLLALATVVFISTPVFAADIPHAWVGGLFGLAVPNYDNTSSRGMFGVTLGAKLGDNLGIGAYYLSSAKDENAGRFNYDLFGVQLSYHFDGDATGAWFGGRVGTSKIDVGQTYSPMNIGAVAGYDYMLTDHLSLGGEVNWMSISESAPLKSFSTLDFLAALKLWF
jgi:hypothetical protein